MFKLNNYLSIFSKKTVSDRITHMKISRYLERIESFKDKKIIITGATAGIGLELAKHLVTKDATLVLLVRNIEKAKGVKKTLLEVNPNSTIDIVYYDQSIYSSIDDAVNTIKDKHSDFYALVANAAIMLPPKSAISAQGYPLTIDTNYLGLKRFLSQINHLFEGKRIIIQGSLISGFHVSKKVDIYSNKYAMFKQYNTSKSCVEALWYHYLVNDQRNEYILTEPGVTSSDIFREIKQPIRAIGKVFVNIVSHSPKKASLTLLQALSKESKSGDFIIPRGLFAISGYPKYKKVPNKRKREFLIN